MIRVEMRQKNIFQILRPDPHCRKLLVNCHSFREIWMEKCREMRLKHLRRRFGIIDSFRADLPAPACVHEDQALWMLDQKSEDREFHSVFIRCHELPGHIAKIDPIPEGNGFRYADIPALENVNVH
jgi:hypothetical protein